MRKHISKKAFPALVCSLGLVLSAAGVSGADVLLSDGDGLTPIVANTLDFGTVCVNTSPTETVLLAIKRDGNYSTAQVFQNGTTATIAVQSTTDPALSATSPSSSISIPPTWSTAAANTQTASLSSDVTLTAGSTAGSFAEDVVYRATGVKASDSSDLTRDSTLHVTATISDSGDCALSPSDTTAPSISYVLNPASADGSNGWYTSNVTLTWTVTESESPDSLVKTGCVDQSITADQAEQTYSCSATSDGGSAGPVDVKIKRDGTKPTLSPSVSPNPVLLNGSATASPVADDNLSGVASSSCDPVDTSSVGSHSVSCTVTDNAGNTNSAAANYSVIYDWNGFFQPVDNLPILNSVKAGSAVPIKFNLGGNQGLSIMAAGFPASKVITCNSTEPVDAIESTITAGGSSLTFDAVANQYVYVWKTDKAWAGTCRQLQVKLADGTSHYANFKLTK